jgi:pimeloyl-ACP methyl ester carboxylesterase
VTTSLLGYGDTDERRTPNDVSIEREVDVIEAVIQRTNGAVHLVGHSYGSTVFLATALRGRAKIASMTLIEATPFNLFATPAISSCTRQKFVVNHPLTILRGTVAALFSRSYVSPWEIAAVLPDDGVCRGCGCHFQHQHLRGSLLSTRTGRGYFYGPYSAECRSQHRLAGGFD